MRLNYQLRKWIVEKVEQYIKEHTMNCSNLNKTVYHPWLTPDQTRKVADIAREETIKEVCEWIKCNVGKYSWYDLIKHNVEFNVSGLIDDLKKYLEGKA